MPSCGPSSGSNCCDCKANSKKPDHEAALLTASSDAPLSTKAKWFRDPANLVDQFEAYDASGGLSPKIVADNRKKEDATEDPWTYAGDRLQALLFPLGGYGTGHLLVQGDGSLQGWNIQNNFHNQEYTPTFKLPGNLFGIQAGQQAYVLQTPQNYTTKNCRKHFREESHVTPAQVQRLEKLPGIRSLQAKCQYPIATFRYDIPGFPVEVQMECTTPMIPGNTKDSSLPLAVFKFSLHNPTDQPVTVSFLQSTLNFIGWDGKTNVADGKAKPTSFWQDNVNTPVSTSHYAGWVLTNQNKELDQTLQGSLALVAMQKSNSKVGLLTTKYACNQDDAETVLWQDFCQNKMTDPQDTDATDHSPQGATYMGGVTQTITVAPQSTETCQFVLTWFFPNRPLNVPRDNLPDILGNYYQNWFANSTQVVDYFVQHADPLLDATRQYVQTLYSSTIPFEFLESAAGRTSVMRSPSMFWTQAGICLGNEGNNCCPLNCTHVYGYSMLCERLFPGIAKDMLYSNFVRKFNPSIGGCTMRFGDNTFAIDGGLACVLKVYLVVLQADSNHEFLKQVWPNVKKQMEIVFERYAKDGDMVIRGQQQNTYDTAMQGANTFVGSYWVSALRATALMAQMMGDDDFAKQCQSKGEIAAAAYEKICWNEGFQYYVADVDASNAQHSYGTGCFIDQLCAVGLSLAAGLGNVFDPEHEASARSAIFHYNRVQKPPFQDFQNHFYNGDKGIRVNTYPHGKIPGCYVYDDLVSTGFSYPVIASMIHDGGANKELALQWARDIRERHSGVNRSPWNEPECGLLYVRAMAAWNLYDQACGFHYNSITGSLKFSPKFNAHDFSCFFIVENGWGRFQQTWDEATSSGKITIKCFYGDVQLSSLATDQLDGCQATASLGGSGMVDTVTKERSIVFADKLSIPTGSALSITFSNDKYPSKMLAQRSVTSGNALKKHLWLAILLVGALLAAFWQLCFGESGQATLFFFYKYG